MVTITPQGLFAIIAVAVALGFTLDYFFRRTRITSILPLMLLGLLVVQVGILDQARVNDLVTISGFVSAIAVAMILLMVGLEIDLVRLYAVFGRAMAWTLVCQAVTGVAISILVLYTFHWPVLWCFVFGFAVSGPSSIVVQALVRQLVMKEELKTTVLFEAVITDVLQLVVPTLLIAVYMEGSVSGASIASTVLLAVFGSIALGVVAGLIWVWALDKGRAVAKGYTWALTAVIALGLYSAATFSNMTGSLVVFIFGVIVGNAAILDWKRGTTSPPGTSRTLRMLVGLRRFMKVSAAGIDVGGIARIQREVTYIIGAFFFFYIGILFVAPAPSVEVYVVPVIAIGLILAIRYLLLPILKPFLETAPALRREQRGLIALNIPRGLSAAVVATLVISIPGVPEQVPGFLDAIFMVILLTNVVSTVGVFLFYRPRATAEPPVATPAASLGTATFTRPPPRNSSATLAPTRSAPGGYRSS